MQIAQDSGKLMAFPKKFILVTKIEYFIENTTNLGSLRGFWEKAKNLSE